MTNGQVPGDVSDKLWDMFTQQLAFQESLGYDFENMTVPERIEFAKTMYIATVQELNEFLDEISWKPWAAGEPKFDEERAMGELIDAWHFLMNLVIVTLAGRPMTSVSNEFHVRYRKKIAVNWARQRRGYDGVSTKCPECKRALDEPGATQRVELLSLLPGDVKQYEWRCSGCDAVIPFEILSNVHSST